MHIETASAVTRAGLVAILSGHGEIEIVASTSEADV